MTGQQPGLCYTASGQPLRHLSACWQLPGQLLIIMTFNKEETHHRACDRVCDRVCDHVTPHRVCDRVSNSSLCM